MTSPSHILSSVVGASFGGMALLGIYGCTTTPTPTQQSVAGAVTTLASFAAANNSTAAKLVNDGLLFCNYADSAPGATALAIAAGLTSPTSVAHQAANDVSAVCPQVVAGMKAVSPPSDVPLNTVPVVVSAAAAGLKAP